MYVHKLDFTWINIKHSPVLSYQEAYGALSLSCIEGEGVSSQPKMGRGEPLAYEQERGGEEDQTVALRLDEVAGWINT